MTTRELYRTRICVAAGFLLQGFVLGVSRRPTRTGLFVKSAEKGVAPSFSGGERMGRPQASMVVCALTLHDKE